MALAPIAYTIWQNEMKYDPTDPTWPVRDRFVLSCGHASMLLYSMLHLTEVQQYSHGKPTGELACPIEHVKKFRQLHYRDALVTPSIMKRAVWKRRLAR